MYGYVVMLNDMINI